MCILYENVPGGFGLILLDCVFLIAMVVVFACALFPAAGFIGVCLRVRLATA